MTTDPIAAARALIEPLTGYTPAPWRAVSDHPLNACANVRAGHHDVATLYGGCEDVPQPVEGEPWGPHPIRDATSRLIAAAPALRDMVATLADALEAARVTTKRATDGWSAAQDAKIAALERAEKVETGRDALVAAAYVVAADACKACAPSPAGGPSSRTNSMRAIAFDCASSVRCLTPADAQAALDKLLADALEAERAKVAAAYNEAAIAVDFAKDTGDRTGFKSAIRALTPADAQAALDKLLTEARLGGWRAGRDDAAEIAVDRYEAWSDSESCPVVCDVTACADVADAIRALAPSDAQAALDKLLEEARLEGWRAGRDAAAQEAEDWFYDPQADEVTDYRLSLNIRMMPEPQEASPAGRSEADARRRYAVQLLHQAVDLAMSQAEGRA